MAHTSTPGVVRLAPPGAGLPWPELQIARLLFRFRRLRGSRASFDADMERERRLILGLVGDASEEDNADRVLIPRLRGLEDSSRQWSAWMTLDHLRIVNEGVVRIMGELLAGRAPAGTASTAAVKPSIDVDSSVIESFERSCDSVSTLVAGAATLRTAVHYAHPWFGPLDAFGWHAMVSMHMSIHRRQIEAIRCTQRACNSDR